MDFLMGVFGALCVVILLVVGLLIGWKLKDYMDKRRVRKTAAELTEKEIREMAAQQEAFRQMQSYTPEIAYGYKLEDMESNG